MTKENKKAIEELLKQKGIRHYVFETKDKEKLDLVEYKEYKKLEKQKQELIDYLKEKKKEYTELYNKSCDIIDFDRYESLNILCEEILSKIEKE